MQKKKAKSRKKTTKKSASNSGDILQLILKDHQPLKKLIEVLKDSDAKKAEKKTAFEKFAPTLMAHAKPEEESLYVHLKEDKVLRAEGFEGNTEHAIADQLIEEIKRTHDEDEWMAKVKVLAEMVEHHIEEEEGEMSKMVRKEFDLETRIEIGEEYLRLRADFRDETSDVSRMKNKRSNNEVEKFL